MPTRRWAWPILISAIALSGMAAWWVHGRRAPPGSDAVEVVTVRSSPPTMTVSPAGPTMSAEAPLEPPRPPALPDAVSAAPDAFVGHWRAADGQGLVVTMQGHDGRYGVVLGEERYDGVLKDGRVHFPRGIDGDWLQAVRNSRCLYLGTGMRFCRS